MSDQSKPNIVQAEFLPLLGSKKTVVRFFDEGGDVSALVLEHERVLERYRVALDTVHRVPRRQKVERYRQLETESKKLRALRTVAQRAVISRFSVIASSASSCIAVEDSHDKPFRLAKIAELSILYAAAISAADLWIFVFKPNQLLADVNEPIAKLLLS